MAQSRYNLTNILKDNMNLNDATVNLDNSSGYYVLQPHNIPLHTNKQEGCSVALNPPMYNDKSTICYPADIASMYLFTNLDTQLMLTYSKHYGSRQSSYKLGNVNEVTLREEITHIIENNLSNIIAYDVLPESCFIDLSLDENIRTIMTNIHGIKRSYLNGTLIPKGDFNFMSLSLGGIQAVFDKLIENFMRFVGYGELSRQFEITVNVGNPINVPNVNREQKNSEIDAIIATYADKYEKIEQYRFSMLMKKDTEIDELIESFNVDMNAKFSEILSQNEIMRRIMTSKRHIVDSHLAQHNPIIFSRTMIPKNTDYIRFNTKFGGIVILEPHKNDSKHGYIVRDVLFPQAEQNLHENPQPNKKCVFCDVSVTNTLFDSSKYKLGITSAQKYFGFKNGRVMPTAMARENIGGKSYYLDSDGDERILSYPHTHSETHKPCQFHGNNICGIHTYYYNNNYISDDTMLFNMLETLKVAKTYAVMKYGTNFMIGDLDYNHLNGSLYKYVKTGKPTIYPVFHLYQNSVPHLHLHTWICKSGNALRNTLDFAIHNTTCENNIGKDCAIDVFGNAEYSTNSDPHIVAPQINAADPTFIGGSFEYAFKKMLGIPNDHPLMKKRFIFEEPQYELHKRCYIDDKQKFHKRNMELINMMNKMDIYDNPNYDVFTTKIPKIQYKLQTQHVSQQIVNCNKSLINTYSCKQLISMFISLATPENSHIAGWFTRSIPICDELNADHSVIYMKHPELCIMSPKNSFSHVVTNSKYTTCNNNNIKTLITQLCTSIFAYHKMYTVTINSTSVNIGQLWKDILTKLGGIPVTDTHADASRLAKMVSPYLSDTTTNWNINTQRGGMSGVDMLTRQPVFDTTTITHDQSQLNIPNIYKIKSINNHRHLALSKITNNDVILFAKNHNNLFNHNGDVDIIFDDDNYITVNAKDLQVDDTFIGNMTTLLMYHQKT